MNPRGGDSGTGYSLIPHGGNCGRSWTDEYKPGVKHCLGEVITLRQETVSRVNGSGAALFCDVDDLIAAQVGFAGRRGTQQVGLIRLPYMQRGAVGFGIDRDCT